MELIRFGNEKFQIVTSSGQIVEVKEDSSGILLTAVIKSGNSLEPKYKIKIGISHINCIGCGFMYDTALGDFDSETEALTLAEELHKDNKPKCKNRSLIVELSNLRYEIKVDVKTQKERIQESMEFIQKHGE